MKKHEIVLMVLGYITVVCGVIAIDHNVGFTLWYGHASYLGKVGLCFGTGIGAGLIGGLGRYGWMKWRARAK